MWVTWWTSIAPISGFSKANLMFASVNSKLPLKLANNCSGRCLTEKKWRLFTLISLRTLLNLLKQMKINLFHLLPQGNYQSPSKTRRTNQAFVRITFPNHFFNNKMLLWIFSKPSSIIGWGRKRQITASLPFFTKELTKVECKDSQQKH